MGTIEVFVVINVDVDGVAKGLNVDNCDENDNNVVGVDDVPVLASVIKLLVAAVDFLLTVIVVNDGSMLLVEEVEGKNEDVDASSTEGITVFNVVVVNVDSVAVVILSKFTVSIIH